jgi:hypothetical protein
MKFISCTVKPLDSSMWIQGVVFDFGATTGYKFKHGEGIKLVY